MKMFTCVGGSQDGGEIGIPGGLRIGEVIRLPSRQGQRLTEAYEYRDDGRLHLLDYKLPPMVLPNDPAAAAELQEELKLVATKISHAVDGLEQWCQANGYIPRLGFGKWELRLIDGQK